MNAHRRRVALVGPEAAGKTTLAQQLSSRTGLTILEDPRPSFLEGTGCHTLYEAARYEPVWKELCELQLRREQECEGPALLDTCAADYWVLWQRWGWCQASPELTEELYARVMEAVNRYTTIIVLPPVQTAPFLGHRFLNRNHTAQVHRLTRALLVEADATSRTLFLSEDSLEARLEAIQNRLASSGF